MNFLVIDRVALEEDIAVESDRKVSLDLQVNELTDKLAMSQASTVALRKDLEKLQEAVISKTHELQDEVEVCNHLSSSLPLPLITPPTSCSPATLRRRPLSTPSRLSWVTRRLKCSTY